MSSPAGGPGQAKPDNRPRPGSASRPKINLSPTACRAGWVPAIAAQDGVVLTAADCGFNSALSF